MPQRHTIEVGIIVKDDGSIAVEKFNDNLKKTDETLKDAEKTGSKFGAGFDKFVSGAYERAGQMATNFLSQIPGQIVELGKLGAQAQAAELRFNQFAGGAERAEEFMTAFNAATMGTVDQMGAMSSAARLLQMGLVDNAEEMASVAEMATKLGDQTMGATSRISDFALMMANQSIPRLDNFGISSGKVRARIKELQKATADLSREEAFKIAVMEEGAKSLNTLGDTSELAQVKIDKITAAIQDAKIGLGGMLIGLVDGIGGVDRFTAQIRGIPVALDQAILMMRAMGKAMSGRNILQGKQVMEDFGIILRATVRERNAANIVFEDAAFIERVLTDRTADLNMETDRARVAIAKIAASGDDSAAAFNQYQAALDSARIAEDNMAAATLEANRVLAEQQRIADEATVTQTELASALFKASDAEIATTAIRELGTLLDEDKITTEEYATAVTETQVAFGLADEASIRLATGLLDLTGKFGDGQVKAENFDDALNALITATNKQRTAVDELGTSIDDLPESKTINIDVIVNEQRTTSSTSQPSTPTSPGFTAQHGFNGMVGPGFGGARRFTAGEGASPERVIVQPVTNNEMNMTVNTRASTPSVTQDFAMMRALVA